jgi:hypothetical protein
MRFVVCYADSKIPIGADWASKWTDAEGMAAHRAYNPRSNFGVLLGPDDGIDVECDSEEATAPSGAC